MAGASAADRAQDRAHRRLLRRLPRLQPPLFRRHRQAGTADRQPRAFSRDGFQFPRQPRRRRPRPQRRGLRAGRRRNRLDRRAANRLGLAAGRSACEQVLVLGAEEFDPARARRLSQRALAAAAAWRDRFSHLRRRGGNPRAPRTIRKMRRVITDARDGFIYRTKKQARGRRRESPAHARPPPPLYRTAQRNWLGDVETAICANSSRRHADELLISAKPSPPPPHGTRCARCIGSGRGCRACSCQSGDSITNSVHWN